MMVLLQKIKILFLYGPELEEIVNKLKKEKAEMLWESRKNNLNLCYKHRQEHNHSHYSEQNCDYCNLLKETRN